MAVNVTDANFQEEVLNSDKPVLADFWAEWCGACKMIAPAVDQISQEYEGRLKVCKVNVEEAPKTASQYGVMSIPTLTIFKDGKIQDQVVGALSKPDLEKKLQPHIS